MYCTKESYYKRKNYFKHVLKKDQINPMCIMYINLYSRLGGMLLVADLCYSDLICHLL